LLPRLFLRRKLSARGFRLTACLALLVSAISIASGCGGGGPENTPPSSSANSPSHKLRSCDPHSAVTHTQGREAG
jgi:hypothetical protein